MANSINSISTGTGGLQSTADGTSGNLLIQKDAGTIATFSSTGVVVSGVVAATTLTGDGSALTGISSGGLTLLTTATLTALGASTVTLGSLDLSTYKVIYIFTDNMSLTSGTGGNPTITPNGGSAVETSAGWANTVSMNSLAIVDLSTGVALSNFQVNGAVNASIVNWSAYDAGGWKNSGISTATTSLAFTSPAGGNYLTGTIKLYGLK